MLPHTPGLMHWHCNVRARYDEGMSKIGMLGRILLGFDLLKTGLGGLAGAGDALLGDVETSPSRDGKPYKVTRAAVRSIDERVQYIIGVARRGKRDPAVQQTVASILNRKCGFGQWCIKEKDEAGEVRAVFAFVRSKMRYMKDPRGVDVFRSPRRSATSVERGGFAGGDCDDFTAALCAYLEAAGYHTKMRVMAIKPDGPRSFSHIIALVGLPARKPSKWVPLDASVDKPAGWYPQSRVSGYKDFDVPE